MQDPDDPLCCSTGNSEPPASSAAARVTPRYVGRKSRFELTQPMRSWRETVEICANRYWLLPRDLRTYSAPWRQFTTNSTDLNQPRGEKNSEKGLPCPFQLTASAERDCAGANNASTLHFAARYRPVATPGRQPAFRERGLSHEQYPGNHRTGVSTACRNYAANGPDSREGRRL